MDEDPQEPNENESQESNDNETHSTTEEGMIETPENVTVGMKELTDLLGISKEILPDFSNLGSIIPLLNARVKLLISASRELKNDYAQIKQEMEQVTTASKDETEKDNLIHDLTQKIHQLRDATLRLSSEFQKRIGSDISAEDMDAILEKIEEFRSNPINYYRSRTKISNPTNVKCQKPKRNVQPYPGIRNRLNGCPN